MTITLKNRVGRPVPSGLVAVVAVAAMVVSPAAASTSAGAESRFVLDRAAINRAVADETRAQRDVGDASDWTRVTSLNSGVLISLGRKQAGSAEYTFVHADDTVLVALDTRALPPEAARALTAVLQQNPDDFHNVLTRQRYVRGRVAFGPDGVFMDRRKIAAIADVVVSTPRAEVESIALAGPRRNRAAFLATGVGLVIGAAYVNWRACNRCSEPMMTSKGFAVMMPGIGFLIAGARRGESNSPARLIYRP